MKGGDSRGWEGSKEEGRRAWGWGERQRDRDRKEKGGICYRGRCEVCVSLHRECKFNLFIRKSWECLFASWLDYWKYIAEGKSF